MVALLCKIVYGRLQIDKFNIVTYGRLGKNCLEAFISGRPFCFFQGKEGADHGESNGAGRSI